MVRQEILRTAVAVARVQISSVSAALLCCLVVGGCDDTDATFVPGLADDDVTSDEGADETDGETYDEPDVEPITSALFSGVNGSACRVSPYNCKLRKSGGNRVKTNDPTDDDSWGVRKNVPVLDGHGNVLANSTRSRIKFNYGQKRSFLGEDWGMALSTSNSSAGWFPLSAVYGEDALRGKLGHVSAKGAGLDELGCYEVRDSADETLAAKKVVYNTTSNNERAGDYLPLVRANGKRSINLVFNVPGMALGGPAIDHFPAGTKFQRLDVPTDHGVPSIDIPLWVKDSSGRYRRQSGSMKFLYGYVLTDTGSKRNGWMAYDALRVSEDCGAPAPLPQPGDGGTCYARCCNDVLLGPVEVEDAQACHEASQLMCASDDHVLRSEFDEEEVWERARSCWAKCNNRSAYHIVEGVSENCTEHAAAWCDQSDRGGLDDAAWSRCEP